MYIRNLLMWMSAPLFFPMDYSSRGLPNRSPLRRILGHTYLIVSIILCRRLSILWYSILGDKRAIDGISCEARRTKTCFQCSIPEPGLFWWISEPNSFHTYPSTREYLVMIGFIIELLDFVSYQVISGDGEIRYHVHLFFFLSIFDLPLHQAKLRGPGGFCAIYGISTSRQSCP
jgi:hypothetical protein